MEANGSRNGCHMGIKTLNALTFKLSVTQILVRFSLSLSLSLSLAFGFKFGFGVWCCLFFFFIMYFLIFALLLLLLICCFSFVALFPRSFSLFWFHCFFLCFTFLFCFCCFFCFHLLIVIVLLVCFFSTFGGFVFFLFLFSVFFWLYFRSYLRDYRGYISVSFNIFSLVHIYIFSNLQAKVANDAFFFLFDDAIIPDMLREMFVVNDSIYEVSLAFVFTFLA